MACGKKKKHVKKATTMKGIYNELMRTSKKFRNSTPRSREITVKRVHTMRKKKR
jgi:hypothetical protein